jgi:hypothetical protein
MTYEVEHAKGATRKIKLSLVLRMSAVVNVGVVSRDIPSVKLNVTQERLARDHPDISHTRSTRSIGELRFSSWDRSGSDS